MISRAHFDFSLTGEIKTVITSEEFATVVYKSKWSDTLYDIALRWDNTDLNDVEEFLENCVSPYALGQFPVNFLRMFAIALSNRVQEIQLQRLPKAQLVRSVNQMVQEIFSRIVSMKRRSPHQAKSYECQG